MLVLALISQWLGNLVFRAVYEQIIKTGNKKTIDMTQHKGKCLKSLSVNKDLSKTLWTESIYNFL